MLQKIKLYFWNRRRNVKKLFPHQKHLIIYAFTVDNTDYYQFDDVFALPYERGLMALATYEETRLKCSREYMEKHVAAMRKLLHEPKIDIFKINVLNEQMNERLNLVFDVDLLYKLAAVVFFDKNENPVLYEQDYCQRKIEFWKAHKGVADFFLQKPISELIPFLKSAKVDLNTYSEINTDLNRIHLELLQSV
jgi:hypothetical protein